MRLGARRFSLPRLSLASCVAVALVAFALATWDPDPGTATPVANGGADPTWRHDPLWDDGQAEFAAYEVTWRRYGQLYTGRVLLVLVKEPWAPDLGVKADRPRPDGFDVLKLNHVRDVPTGIYTYHQMASIHFRRDNGAVVKLVASSTEACGVATARLAAGMLDTHSYFDGEGDRRIPYPAAAIPEDALPALLRDYVRGEPPERLQIFPMLLAGRFGALEPEWVQVRKGAEILHTVPAGTFTAIEIVLQNGEKTLTYIFEAAAPHRMLRFHGADGTEYRLAKVDRMAYWSRHAPGDEAWWPAHLRDHGERTAAPARKDEP